MGGRGANSSRVVYQYADKNGMILGRLYTKNGKTMLQHIDEKNPTELPKNKTLTQYLANIKKAGGSVTKITQKQLKEEQKKYTEERKKTDDMLNYAYLRDKTFVSGSRMNRISNRKH